MRASDSSQIRARLRIYSANTLSILTEVNVVPRYNAAKCAHIRMAERRCHRPRRSRALGNAYYGGKLKAVSIGVAYEF